MYTRNIILFITCIYSFLNGYQGGTVTNNLWPDGIIVYEMDAAFDDGVKDEVHRAMAAIEDVTCIMFNAYINEQVSFTDIGLDHTQLVRFEAGANAGICQTDTVGKDSNGDPNPQIVQLGTHCDADPVRQKREIMQVLLQLVGMHFEHQRPDRDLYIDLINTAMVAGSSGDFSVLTGGNYDATDVYDMSSIMHGDEAFRSISPTQYTIKPKDTLYHNSDVGIKNLGGHVRGNYYSQMLSQRDKLTLNRVYDCTADCSLAPACQNDGYVDKTCTCQCDPRTVGYDCGSANVLNDYSPNQCTGSGDISGSGILTSPNYPSGFITGTKCYWLIKSSDPLLKLGIRVVDLDLQECHLDSLSIYTSGPAVPTKRISCATSDLDTFKNKWFMAQGDRIYVQFRSQAAGVYSPDMGFKIQYGMGCIIGGSFDILCGQTTTAPPVFGQTCHVCSNCESSALGNSTSTQCPEDNICQITSNYARTGPGADEYTVTHTRSCAAVTTCDLQTPYTCTTDEDAVTAQCVSCCDALHCNIGESGNSNELPDWIYFTTATPDDATFITVSHWMIMAMAILSFISRL